MKAAELIVRCLENEGVGYIFGIPGEENLDLVDALADSTIQFVTTRHEQGAAFMADVYGRLTGEAGVCLATLGPGATNLLTGVADANMDRAPLVALTGQANSDRLHKESHQSVDVMSLFRPVTKWNASVRMTEVIPEAIRKAFKVAQSEKPGATHVEIPEDIARAEIDAAPLLVQSPLAGPASAEQIERAAHLIRRARQSVILAGNGIVRARATDALVAFAEKLNIPVATTFMAKGVISDLHPLSHGAIGLQMRDYINRGLAQADTIIAVGYDLVEYAPSFWNPNHDKTIIHINQSPAEVDAAYILGVGVVGDLATSLRELTNVCGARQETQCSHMRQALRDELEQHAEDTAFPLKPQRILSDLRRALRDDDIVVSDVGAHKLWLARLFPCYQPNTRVISNGFASMGIAVPGAIAAKLVHPNRRVVAVTGDGGFLMNSQELETAVRFGTGFVTLVLNDNTYGLIKWKQINRFERVAFTDFDNPDFVKYAESFGAQACRVETSEELMPAILSALDSGKVSVIDCPTNFAENLRLSEALGSITELV